MKFSKILIIVFIFILISGTYYYINSDKNINNNIDSDDKKEVENDNKEEDKINCIENYECIKVDDKIYKFSKKTSILVKEMYDFDTSEMEVGTLKIKDNGKLVFENTKNEILKTYDNIEGKVIAIDSTRDGCDLFFVALSDSGKVYKSEIEDGLLVEQAFYELADYNNIKKISLYNEENVCDNNYLIGYDENNKIINLLIEE